ncbi:MAG TPA: Mrp/NBP35 family ATP-binding protein [Bacilli bacterium]
MKRNQVLDALRELQDPQLQKSLVDMRFVKDIMIREDSVSITLVLSKADDHTKDEYKKLAVAALAKAGIKAAHVRIREATAQELSSFREKKVEEIPHTEGYDAMQDKVQHEMRKAGMPKLLEKDATTQFIAVASGKGGVGKSTVTVNLAVALARRGKKVGIMDCDIYGFSVPDLMGIEEYPQLVNRKVIPVQKNGVDVISMGFFVEDNAPIVWRGPMLGKMLRNFFNEVEWGNVEYMLLDLPPGTGDIALDVHQMIPHSKEIIVTTPHSTAAFVAARAGAMARGTNHEILGVVENMSYYVCAECGHKDYIFGRGGGAKLAQELGTELLGQIPLGAPDNHPLEADYAPAVYKEDSETGKMYLEMADLIIAKTS